jgi:hypothetical protein
MASIADSPLAHAMAVTAPLKSLSMSYSFKAAACSWQRGDRNDALPMTPAAALRKAETCAKPKRVQ